MDLSDIESGLRAGDLSPEVLELRIGFFMRCYLRERSSAFAHAVVEDIEALCAHPDYPGTHDERCVYRRLARHWRFLMQRDELCEPPLSEGMGSQADMMDEARIAVWETDVACSYKAR